MTSEAFLMIVSVALTAFALGVSDSGATLAPWMLLTFEHRQDCNDCDWPSGPWVLEHGQLGSVQNLASL